MKWVLSRNYEMKCCTFLAFFFNVGSQMHVFDPDWFIYWTNIVIIIIEKWVYKRCISAEVKKLREHDLDNYFRLVCRLGLMM